LIQFKRRLDALNKKPRSKFLLCHVNWKTKRVMGLSVGQ
jgi:hypothetical protein